ncbi:hypothetical protein AGABI2DRAFT_185052 [Agaricus bisporus var. bisporus H97]|uniref:hypothetical protein n=1 Tax=Agaricus bisporus var. bisporus (strain H97 / ATCC MYA-4626 / FGSC 10389) TaxID=936046 RepID=UPI00029F57D1|nr:hypothetical protein AGABI2DRAFT_185052 [Agaricus bisporus var. bisporus H97]EKV47044.1 hypothetical protein AGABI2DRAFT_185052 [Agaricus bisporus var. bisporus H97]
MPFMSRIALNFFVVLLAITAGIYQFYIKDLMILLGYNRIVESIGNENCRKVPELKACEDMVLHEPSGLLFLACSEPQRRIQWLPAVNRLNTAGASKDSFVVYNPETSQITKLKLSGLDDNLGFSSHGIDIVTSASNSSELFVFLVNHRPQSDAEKRGADSVVEIFKHTINTDKLEHIKTLSNPLVSTPNDIIGSDDGKSFFLTNDHGQKVGFARHLDIPFGRKTTSVVYCHVNEGCKYAIQGMSGNNGIARAPNGTFYVGSISVGLTVLERQTDNTLVVTDIIKTDRGMDNLSIDSEGHVWAASFPKILITVGKHFEDPSLPAPSSALRFSINTGPNAFYGEKYKVDKAFEDDGHIASGITTVVHDARHRRLFLHGLAASHLTICEV